MISVSELYTASQNIKQMYKDTTFVPRLENGLISKENKEKYSELFEHNERIFKLERQFNGALTKKQQLELRKFKRQIESEN